MKKNLEMRRSAKSLDLSPKTPLIPPNDDIPKGKGQYEIVLSNIKQQQQEIANKMIATYPS